MTLMAANTCNMDSPERASLLSRGEKEILEARVIGRLRRSPYPEIRRVICEFHEGMLFLRGRVSSYYLKQIAQTAVLETGGSEEVNNQLEVLTPSPAGERNVLPEGFFESKALDSKGGGKFHKEDV